jgi:Sec-independent protein translocase protein TatA
MATIGKNRCPRLARNTAPIVRTLREETAMDKAELTKKLVKIGAGLATSVILGIVYKAGKAADDKIDEYFATEPESQEAVTES